MYFPKHGSLPRGSSFECLSILIYNWLRVAFMLGVVSWLHNNRDSIPKQILHRVLHSRVVGNNQRELNTELRFVLKKQTFVEIGQTGTKGNHMSMTQIPDFYIARNPKT